MGAGHAHSHSGHGSADKAAHQQRAANRTARSLGLAVAFTLGYALVEAIGGLWAGSLALLADAGHMATDSAALLFAFAASLIARRPASDRHSYGLARVEVVAAFVNALAMLAIVAWIVVEAVARMTAPVSVKGFEVFVIASVGLLVNLLVAWSLSGDRHNVNTRAAYVHVLGDLFGSVAAIASGLIIYLGGPVVADSLLSMLVAGLVLRSTIGVLRESTLVLLNSVPTEIDFAAVGNALARIPGIVAVHDLHVWAMVPGRSAMSAHVLVEDIERWPVILYQARGLLEREFQIDHVTLQPEWLRGDRQGRVPVYEERRR